MEELFNINFSEQDIKNMIEINPSIKELNKEEIEENINFLRKIQCNERQIKSIIICNPFFLSRSIDDLVNLVGKLKYFGITNLNITFDSNPFLLNKDDFEIDEFINEKMMEGRSKEEAIDLIDSGMID